jgi:membrane fusion protein (multidrug efflux system)
MATRVVKFAAFLAASLFVCVPPALAQGPGAAPPAVAVEAHTVASASMVDTIRAIGTLRANQSIVVRPEIAGLLSKINFKDAQLVEKGATLFQLDDSMDRALLVQAEAALKLAEVNHARAQELLNRGAGTAQARDTALSTLLTDRAAVVLARARLEKSTIKAAFTGIVGIAKVDLGAYVTAGQDLVSLDDIDTVKLDFEVPERFARFVAVGQKVGVEADAFPGRSFAGEIATIATRVDPESRSLGVRALVPNPDRLLKPGLFARVTVDVEVRPDAVAVPEQAIVPRGDRLLVYKIVDGKAVSATVKVGLREYGRVEVVEGLARGDVVITAGQQKVQDGTPVTVLAPRDPATPMATPAQPRRAPGGPAPASAAEPARP